MSHLLHEMPKELYGVSSSILCLDKEKKEQSVFRLRKGRMMIELDGN
jgi:hypothetical protein